MKTNGKNTFTGRLSRRLHIGRHIADTSQTNSDDTSQTHPDYILERKGIFFPVYKIFFLFFSDALGICFGKKLNCLNFI